MTMMTGIVEEVSQKDVSTKFGVKPTYSFKMGGKWIKCGFKNPHLEVGYQVDFDATSGTYGIETKSVNIISKTASGVAGSSSSPAKVSPVVGSYGKVFPIPPLHGDRSIVRQNALARAVDIFIGSAGGKPYTFEESVTTTIINLAKKFEAYTAGDLDMAEAMDEIKTESSTS